MLPFITLIQFSDDKQLEMHQKDMNVHVVYNNSNNQIC